MNSTEQHSQAYSYCTYCPKVCHFSCPVSASTHQESTSAWGKMNVANQMTKGQRPVDEDASKALFACTGCGRCTEICKHKNQVGPALFAAREVALEAKVSPKAVVSSLTTFTQSQNPFGESLEGRLEPFLRLGPSRYSLFPGCTSLVKASKTIEETLEVASEFGVPMNVGRVSARCCGYPLYAAGDFDAFRQHGQIISQSLEAVPEMAVLDAACAYTFRVLFPKFEIPLKTRVTTVVEVLAQNEMHAPKNSPLSEQVNYHDACHLGRGLGLYEEPRALLRRAVKKVNEAPNCRTEAGCAGGGGLLPRTMPATSVDMAKRLGSTFSEPGTVVTACPTSKRMFERAGHRAEHLMSTLLRWLQS